MAGSPTELLLVWFDVSALVRGEYIKRCLWSDGSAKSRTTAHLFSTLQQVTWYIITLGENTRFIQAHNTMLNANLWREVGQILYLRILVSQLAGFMFQKQVQDMLKTGSCATHLYLHLAKCPNSHWPASLLSHHRACNHEHLFLENNL